MTFKLFFDRINMKAKVKGNKYEKKDYESALRTRCAERTRATQLVCVCASYYLHRTFHGNLCPGRHGGASMNINHVLNEVLVKLFRNINLIEEREICTGEYKDVTANDMHVIEAIDMDGAKNMTSVAKSLGVTTGTLTIAVNSLVKKGYVDRVRSEEDRRVVLISLSGKGRKAYLHHRRFHEKMINAIVEELTEEEKEVLEKALVKLNLFFRA